MRNALVATGIPAAVVAHQGGWDEILLVVGPMAVVAGLLWLAKRRLVRAERAAASAEEKSPPNRTSDDLSPSA
jgi:cyanate permease